jgi:tRNA-binding EMAP/Myf-like protein
VSSADDLQRLDLAVGRVLDATAHPGARGPSLLVTVDLGPRGRRQGTVAVPSTPGDELVGRQVVCVLDPDELLVLGVRSHAHGFVLLIPEREVEDGSIIG